MAKILGTLAALLAAIIAALAVSERLQGLLVFVWFVDWPPVDFESPTLAFPCWSKAACRWDEHEAAWLPPRATRLPDPPAVFPFVGVQVQNATAVRVPTSRAGVALGAWVMHRKRLDTAGATLIYAHGNAGNRATRHRVQLYEQLLSDTSLLVETVVAFDYSGFGDSGGGSESAWDLSEERAVADLLAVDAWVKATLQPCAPVVWWGHSLGTGVALGALERAGADASPDALPAALVLESPFTSVVDVGAHTFGALARMALVHTFESLPRAQLRLVPTLVLHGEHDVVIPLAHGRAIAEAAGATLEVFDSGHDDIVLRRRQLARAVNAFLLGFQRVTRRP